MMTKFRRLIEQGNQSFQWVVSGVVFVAFIAIFCFINVGYDGSEGPVSSPLPSVSPPSQPSPSPSPGVHMIDVKYNITNNHVTGSVIGAEDPSAYKVVVYISDNLRDFFPKPTDKSAVQSVNKDGGFDVQAFTSGGDNETEDKKIKYYCVLLIYTDKKYTDIVQNASEQGVKDWELVRDIAVDREWWGIPTGNSGG